MLLETEKERDRGVPSGQVTLSKIYPLTILGEITSSSTFIESSLSIQSEELPGVNAVMGPGYSLDPECSPTRESWVKSPALRKIQYKQEPQGGGQLLKTLTALSDAEDGEMREIRTHWPVIHQRDTHSWAMEARTTPAHL